jgi:hypothetical protein
VDLEGMVIKITKMDELMWTKYWNLENNSLQGSRWDTEAWDGAY